MNFSIRPQSYHDGEEIAVQIDGDNMDSLHVVPEGSDHAEPIVLVIEATDPACVAVEHLSTADGFDYSPASTFLLERDAGDSMTPDDAAAFIRAHQELIGQVLASHHVNLNLRTGAFEASLTDTVALANLRDAWNAWESGVEFLDAEQSGSFAMARLDDLDVEGRTAGELALRISRDAMSIGMVCDYDSVFAAALFVVNRPQVVMLDPLKIATQ